MIDQPVVPPFLMAIIEQDAADRAEHAAAVEAAIARSEPAEPAPNDAQLIAERRTPAYTAVREYIQTWPPGTADPTTVTRIWRALELGLDAMQVGQCESSHCVEDGHVIMAKPDSEAPDWTLDAAPRTILDSPAGQSALEKILADANRHELCVIESQTHEGGISHSSIAAGLRIAARHILAGQQPPKEQS
ncbi:hypothetical protein ACFWIB_14595 [Streptomyces sp. NPDC127051]|uniref:hypothetical protein n=1 Tax=Streptomyces sp. NPDC127051 TaxID=3347119 RepID=UPI00366769E0